MIVNALELVQAAAATQTAAAEPGIGRDIFSYLAGSDWLHFDGQHNGWKHYKSSFFVVSVNRDGHISVSGRGRGVEMYVSKIGEFNGGQGLRVLPVLAKIDAGLAALEQKMQDGTSGIVTAALVLVRKLFPNARVNVTYSHDDVERLEVYYE